MRVIGKTDGGMILEATNSEIANLIGYYSDYSKTAKVHELKPGSEIKVGAMFMQLYQLQGKQGELKKLQDALREAADKLTPVIPVIPVIELPKDQS